MRAFSYVWSLSHVTKRASHHFIRRSQKPNVTCTYYGSVFYKSGVMASGSFTLRECGFWTFFVPVTSTLTQSPSYTNLTGIPWKYTRCANMIFLRQAFRKLSSDRRIDMIEFIYHSASRLASNLHDSVYGAVVMTD